MDSSNESVLWSQRPSFCKPSMAFKQVMHGLLSETNTKEFFVYGGPGMGKTLLLDQLHDMHTVGTKAAYEAELGRGKKGLRVEQELAELYEDGVVLLRFGANLGLTPDGKSDPKAEENFRLHKVLELVNQVDREIVHRKRLSGVVASTLAEATALFKMAISGKRHLVLVDDVRASDREVFDALVGATCGTESRLVVTSRAKFGLFNVDVQALALSADSYQGMDEAILASYAYNDPAAEALKEEHQDAASKLLPLCGCKPLTLRIMAGVLRQQAETGSEWQQVVHEMEEHAQTVGVSHGHTIPLAALKLSVSYLSPESKDLVQLLQYFMPAAPIPVSALRVLWVCYANDPTSFNSSLEQLKATSLVEFKPAEFEWQTDSVVFHSLFSLFLTELAESDPTKAAPPLPFIPKTRDVEDSLRAAEDAEAPPLRVLSTVTLLGTREAAASARAGMQGVTFPKDSQVCDWWNMAKVLECDTEGLLAAIERSDLPDGGCELLLAAAAGRVWPGLESLIPKLLAHPVTTLPAMAFVLGTQGVPEMQGWSAECSEALVNLSKALPTTASSVELLTRLANRLDEIPGQEHTVLKLCRQAFSMHVSLGGRLGRSICDDANPLQNLAAALGAAGLSNEALDKEQQLLKMWQRAVGEQNWRTADAHYAVGLTLLELGRHQLALKEQKRALEIRLKVFGEDHVSTMHSYHQLGFTLHQMGRREEAVKFYQHALDICDAVRGESHLDVARSSHEMGITLAELGRCEEAVEQHQRALSILQDALGTVHIETAQTHQELGQTLHEMGRHEEALHQQQQALDIRKAMLGERHSDTAQSMRNVGVTLAWLKKNAEALQHLEQALEIRRLQLGDGHAAVRKLSREMDSIRELSEAA